MDTYIHTNVSISVQVLLFKMILIFFIFSLHLASPYILLCIIEPNTLYVYLYNCIVQYRIYRRGHGIGREAWCGPKGSDEAVVLEHLRLPDIQGKL
jgi:hypothetical protein